MKISIITISYNNEVSISRTINSVLEQTYSNIEYIVVDGASKDRTLEIIDTYADRINKIISEPDNGIYDAINKGIKVSTGEVIGLIHAGDELYDENVIERIAYYFYHNNIEGLYGHSKIFSEDGKKVVRINKSPKYKTNLFPLGWFPSHQSFYVRRDVFVKFGAYSLKYNIAADYELLLRFLYVYKIKVALLDLFIIKFRLGGTSTKSLKNIMNGNKECIKAWEDNGLQIPFYTIAFKLLRKCKQFLA